LFMYIFFWFLFFLHKPVKTSIQTIFPSDHGLLRLQIICMYMYDSCNTFVL
jgi:hypothetical protein